MEAIVLQLFNVYTITFFVFFDHDYSLKLSIGIIIIYNGNSNNKKVVFFKKQFCFAKTHNLLFRKKVQDNPAGNKDVDIVDKDSTSYLIDGRVQLNKTRKYGNFYFLSLK